MQLWNKLISVEKSKLKSVGKFKLKSVEKSIHIANTPHIKEQSWLILKKKR